MITKKFNWKITFFIILFGAAVLFGTYAMGLMLFDQVTMEDGEPMPIALRVFFCVVLSLVLYSYAVTVARLVRQLIKFRRQAFWVDAVVLHHTLVFVNLFAFVFVGRVDLIPWTAVTYVDTDNESLYIRVKARDIQGSRLGKWITAVLGYHFCYTFTTESLSPDEKQKILEYIKSQANITVNE